MTGLEALLAAQPFWAWVAVGGVLLVAELSTGSGYLLWPAAAAFVTGAVVFLAPSMGVFVQLFGFAALTVVFTLAGRRYLPRRLNTGGPPDISNAAARLVGHEGEAAPDARVFVDGKEWAAESEDGAPILPGARVRVTAVLGGARLRVRAV